MIDDNIQTFGNIEIIKEWKNGKKDYLNIKNTILHSGRRALALGLANGIGDSFQFYITRMLFGDGGTTGGEKKFVEANRNGLFGVVQLSKPVLANIDNAIATQVILTSVMSYDEAVGITLNEMALMMANQDLYSMTTFPDLNKTEDMQITFNWRISFI
jgi:hypothetical protein